MRILLEILAIWLLVNMAIFAWLLKRGSKREQHSRAPSRRRAF